MFSASYPHQPRNTSPMSSLSVPPRHSEWLASTELPTQHGLYAMHVFRTTDSTEAEGFREHVALVYGDVSGKAGLPVRVHSECLTGEAFRSLKCDCGDQLDMALAEIVRLGAGIVLYLRQEGRGIGLSNKVRAYHLQSRGYDTVDANRALGLPDDARSYEVVPEMLSHFGVPSISLMTNNPDKLAKLTALGVMVERCRPVITGTNPHSIGYIETKRKRMGHELPEVIG
jgi:GTP cyclohydrolase II